MGYGYELDFYEAEILQITDDLKFVFNIECGIGIKAERSCALHEVFVPQHNYFLAKKHLDDILPEGSRARLKLYTFKEGITLTHYSEVWTLDGRNVNRYLIEQEIAVEV